MTGNLYYIDPMVAGLLPMTDSQRQGLCFLVYLCLVSWFVVHMRNTSQCLPRYSLLGELENFVIVEPTQEYHILL